jgi:hypothetical protein
MPKEAKPKGERKKRAKKGKHPAQASQIVHLRGQNKQRADD